MPPPPVIPCGPCVLRPWCAEDATTLAHHANNLEVARWLRDAFPHPYGPQDARAWIEQVADCPWQWAIEVDGDAIGSIGLAPGTEFGCCSAELGYWLGQSYWGRGIATAAVLGLSLHGIDQLGLLRVYALPLAENVASCRVLEKAAFVREGLLRGAEVKAGQLLDQVLYARTSPSRSLCASWRPVRG